MTVPGNSDEADRSARADSGVVPTFSVGVSVPVMGYPTGLTTALWREVKVEVVSQSVGIPGPPTYCVRIGAPPVVVKSYTFPELPEWCRPAPSAPSGSQQVAAPLNSVRPSSGQTRIQPPCDIVKLQDRLYYLLQPPLESLVSSGQLTFPFQPFPYQYQGVAFLVPPVLGDPGRRNGTR